MLVSDFDFDLPEELIAQTPRPRGTARLLVVDREDAVVAGNRRSLSWRRSSIAGDLLVANDTRVFPARLIGQRDPSGGSVECMLLEREDDTDWQALVHPGQKLKPGSRMVFEDPSRAPGDSHPRGDRRAALLRPAAGAVQSLRARPIWTRR